MAPGFGDPEGGGIAILPGPHSFTGCPSFERNGPHFAIPDARFRVNKYPGQSGRGQSGFKKGVLSQELACEPLW